MLSSAIDLTTKLQLRRPAELCTTWLRVALHSTGVPLSGLLPVLSRLSLSVKLRDFTSLLLNSLNTTCLLETDSRRSTEISSCPMAMVPLSGLLLLLVFLLVNTMMVISLSRADSLGTTISSEVYSKDTFLRTRKKPLSKSSLLSQSSPRNWASLRFSFVLLGLLLTLTYQLLSLDSPEFPRLRKTSSLLNCTRDGHQSLMPRLKLSLKTNLLPSWTSVHPLGYPPREEELKLSLRLAVTSRTDQT
mmetsp:Transcript_54036/g.74094  ORF Transcript_54036/g.74094 Transcript_54036/m.74094 type:complete len:246 (-) Transcript_54036:65-802(-)